MAVPDGGESARAFLPARDFEASKAFYETLGFEKLLDSDVAIFGVGASAFILQRYYRQEWEPPDVGGHRTHPRSTGLEQSGFACPGRHNQDHRADPGVTVGGAASRCVTALVARPNDRLEVCRRSGERGVGTHQAHQDLRRAMTVRRARDPPRVRRAEAGHGVGEALRRRRGRGLGRIADD